MRRPIRPYLAVFALVLACLAPSVSGAQDRPISGTVQDPLGGRVAGATVSLLADGRQAAEAKTGSDGTFTLQNVPAGRYQVVVTAPGFDAQTSEPAFFGPGGRTTVDVTLQVGVLQQAVVVTAGADAVPQSQTGAPITVIDETILDALNKADVLEALRLVPGSQIVQTGARGGPTSFFIRGGNSNFNKVLFDGIPVNDIGGGFDFGQVATAGVERLEVLRQTNSVMYGSDALAGVVNITTKRGRTQIPELEYSLDGGNLGTLSTAISVGGAANRFDYFSSYSRFDTDNDVPNNDYENGTYAGRFGVALGRGTDVSASIRRVDSEFGSPNSFSFFQVADDSTQTKDQTYFTTSARSQWSDRLQSSVRFGWTDERSLFVNPTPSGTPYDPFGFGANYLGQSVRVTGANGYSVTGRAILDFGGTYPSSSPSRTGRRTIAGDTTFQVHPSLAISGGARNEVFESAVTPRLSVAAYLRQPTTSGLGDTKVTLNAGTGIKAPSVFQEQNSLFALVQGTPVAGQVEPIGPERSKSFDIGVEQGFWGGNARARVAYFHNTFEHLLDFLGRTQLVRAGVPGDCGAETGCGAYL